MTVEKLFAIAHGLNRRFPEGNEPYKIMTCLLEEGGELAQMVNHFEGAGTKLEKYGPPDTAKLVKEIRDVLLCGLRVALYYGVEQELESGIDKAYEKMRAEGWIKD
jgi:NTP pyrophosphatase (non-canonical NTP hydrolase)